MSRWPILVQWAGLAAVAVACGLVAVWLGLLVGGVGVLAFGVAAELGADRVGDGAVTSDWLSRTEGEQT